ncbi:CD59 glycoprotein-like [Triplophysa rosa]|uniref:CD59 glycoprotein n=1 Tax=Triplophysa rosa TaxID=992332 RepID=A0A9W7T4X1_TRIRA|nr:CD59 glycoprotein-like [Triplophysa rosa]KAI7790700.1 putative CD59 glycoprotein [Triplophysa rosa]
MSEDYRKKHEMKTLVVLVFSLSLLELGSALKCYTCNKGLCNATQVCTYEDSCLSVNGEGSFRHKQCLKYDDCNLMKVRQMFPTVSSMDFRCCTSNLCNTASLSVASNSLVGLLLSVALFCWSVL